MLLLSKFIIVFNFDTIFIPTNTGELITSTAPHSCWNFIDLYFISTNDLPIIFKLVLLEASRLIFVLIGVTSFKQKSVLCRTVILAPVSTNKLIFLLFIFPGILIL